MTEDTAAKSAQFRLARWLYWVAFVLAVIVAIVLGFTSKGWLPAIGAASVMLVYLVVSLGWTPEAAKHDDFADGFYYLGFLLTLVALVSTLVRIDPEAPDLLTVVLSQFGLALTTTILGLGVRTALRMFAAEPDEPIEVIERAQAELKTAVEALRIVLQAASTDMETTLGAVSDRVGASAESVAVRLDSVAQKVAGVESAFEPLGRELARAAKTAGAFSSQLDLADGKILALSGQVQTLGQSVQNLKEPLETSRKEISSMGQAAHGTAEASQKLQAMLKTIMEGEGDIQRFAAGLNQLAHLGEGVSDFAAAMAKGRTHLLALAEAVGDVEMGLRPLKRLPEILDMETLRTFSSTLQQQVATLQRSVQQWEQGLEDLTRLGQEIGARQRAASSALLSVHDELAAGVAFLKKSVEESRSA